MSDDRQPKRPSHLAYQVSEGQEGKSYFNKVGAAFAHRDGQGYNVVLDSVPVDGRVTLRTPQERLEELRNTPQPQAQQQPQPEQQAQQQEAAPQQQAEPQQQAQTEPAAQAPQTQGQER